MHTTYRIAVIAASVACLATAAWAGPPQVRPDENNIVAAHLAGTWTLDKALSKRLGTSAKLDRVTFAVDPGAIARIPAKAQKFLEKYRIYLAGTLSFLKVKATFVLIARGGHPHVVFFMKKGDRDDAESFYVSLAKARQRKDDVLFIGGDFPREPFVAFRRAK